MRTCPARALGQAEQALHRLRAARADQAVEAENFAGAQGKADAVELGGMREIFDLEHGRAERDRALGENVVDRAPDHQADQARAR